MRVSNNLWGAADGTGRQCIRALPAAGGAIGWSTDWSWAVGTGRVKSYASVVDGWHWSRAPAGTGLPVRLSDRQSVRTRWAFQLSTTSSGAVDVGYDLWFHAVAGPGGGDRPAAEVRILVDSRHLDAPGTLLSTVTVGGARWALYRGQNSWPVYWFVRTAPTASVAFDLRDFTDALSRPQAGRAGLLDAALYLSSVEAGADVVSGTGRLDTSTYSVQVGAGQ